jgi:hypothetical protein
LNNLKLDWISFLQGAITIPDDGGVMNENVRPVIAPDEAVSLGIIKPFHGSLHFDALLTGTSGFFETALGE